MSGLGAEARKFAEEKRRERNNAASRVAFRLAAGIDLDVALASCSAERRRIALRVERLLERERLRGWARHWSYDLNRHVALKQALEMLRRQGGKSDEPVEAHNERWPE